MTRAKATFCGGFCLNVSMFIFLGSLTLSVQNNKLSIIFIPVIKFFSSNFKTFLFTSSRIGVTVPSSWYSIIASKAPLVTNQYKTLFFSSAIAPTHLKSVPMIASTLTLPNIFCTVPTSEPSDVATSIFIASLYCPLGIILSSSSLFMIPERKTFLISGIF